MIKEQILESIQERDIDLLLLEELNVNIEFAKWFVNKLNISFLDKIIKAEKSLQHGGLGETDILFTYEDNKNKKIGILIENKIDAVFQKNQYKRYEKRAIILKNQLKYKETHIILIAPEQFCQNSNNLFKECITYEQIKDWFKNQKEIRFDYKSQLLDIAISKQKRGRNLSEFCNAYFNYILKHNEFSLEFIPPIKPSSSIQISFKSVSLPNFRIYHIFNKNKISISAQIKDLKKDEIKKFETMTNEELQEFKISCSEKKIRIVCNVPEIEQQLPLDYKSIDKTFVLIKKGIKIILEKI